MTTLRELVKDRRLYSVDANRSVLEAARYMMEHNVGAVPVLRDGDLAGILSERDIMNRVVAIGRTPGTTSVSEVMTPNPRCVAPTESIQSAARIMRDEDTGAVPVVENGKVLGMVTDRDIVIRAVADGGKMAAISSGMASIGDNGGGWVPYRTSKAALNMAWSCLALEAQARGIACVLLSPGWVKTRMGGAGAEITSEQSVSDMRALVERLSIEDTGKFLRRDGSERPW